MPPLHRIDRVNLSAVREAAGVVYEAAIRTPLIRIDLSGIDTPLASLYLKLETLQPIGSFKIRGAYNAVRHLTPSELGEGVWTISAGNAAQGVALAARLLGIRASILMIDTAPETKVRAIQRLGASIVRASYDECWRAIIDHRSDRMTGHLVHPFDNDRFIAGNGTIGLEIFEDLPHVDAIVAPLGGGGLLGGIAAAMAELRPETRIFAAEPETASPLAASLAAGRPVYFDGWHASFEEVRRAMRVAAERAHVITEGAAGCAIAAALSGRAGTGRVVAVVSGGNIDLARFASVIADGSASGS